LNRIRQILTEGEKASTSGEELKEKVRETCKAVHGEDLARCMEMGKRGADWLWQKRGGGGKKGLKVITVCNTGSLATSVSLLPVKIGQITWSDHQRT
jgi:methylthioribose-1-phosphate isomerase